MKGKAVTRDLGKAELPPKCLTGSALRTLANALDRLASFHVDLGGQSPDAPCLISVTVGDGHVLAKVISGPSEYTLEFKNGSWEVAGI